MTVNNSEDFVAQATAALKGVTEGPWSADGEPWNQIVWSSAENRVCFMAHSNGLNDDRDVATARFIAFARQWVPEAAARIAALTATVAEVTREKDRVADINRNLCNSHNTLLVDGSNWQRHAEAAERESATLRARLARMEGAINRWAEHDGEHGYDLVVRELIASTLPEALTDGGSNG